MHRRDVTVLGLGAMGRAIARSYLAAGYGVTVWNRTASRAAELVADGARPAASPAVAVAASDVIVVCLTDVEATQAVLAPVGHPLRGRTVVDLSSGTPGGTRRAADVVTSRGGAYLSGGVRVPPSGIGAAGSSTAYSGPRDAFEAVRTHLEVLTGADHLGDDPGLAMLHFQLEEDLLWTTMVGYLHALAIADANGVSAEEFQPAALRTMTTVQDLMAFFAPRIDAGEHRGDVDRLATGLAGAENVVRVSEEAGVDVALPALVRDLFRRGVAAGHAEDSASSLFTVLRDAEVAAHRRAAGG